MEGGRLGVGFTFLLGSFPVLLGCWVCFSVSRVNFFGCASNALPSLRFAFAFNTLNPEPF